MPQSPTRQSNDRALRRFALSHRGMMSVVRLLLLGLSICLVSAGAAQAEKRVALVIGNGSYQGLKPLRNPVNDAGDIGEALKEVGFEVYLGIDLDRPLMQDAIARFAAATRDADVSLVYYAGHGFQVSSQNYLVPVDAILRTPEDVKTKTIELRTIMDALEASKGLKLVFLDACRNNPLPPKAGGDTAMSQNGLARVGNSAGFLIAFATQPDNVAFDGGGRNSPFAQALLSHMSTRGQDIASMMISVRKDVLASTGGYQVPWENSSLTRQFYFAPGSALAASPETQLWQLAATARDPALLRIYAERYPDGSHIPDVLAMIQDTETKVAGLPEGSGASRSLPGADKMSEEALWELARRTRSRSLVEFYLSRNSSGRFAEEARTLLSALPRPGSAEEPPEVACQRLATHPRDETANIPGVTLSELAKNADRAIDACRRASTANPDMAHFTALLARAMSAAGRKEEAIQYYREAAERGNLRALVSLGLITETGDGVPKDPKAAVELYERASAGGSPDGSINLAVALMQGTGIPRDPARAVALLTKASEAGSAIATFNLGVLAQSGTTGTPASAIDFFKKATELGDPRGYLAAAILLDEGRGVRKDPTAAAKMLLQGVASDSGDSLSQFIAKPENWAPDTIKAVQTQLKKVGYYNGAIDGKGGSKLTPALKLWRRSGPSA